MKNKTGSFIITSAKSRVAYNILRSLGKRGVKGFVSDFEKLTMSSASRYSEGSFMYPSPFSDPEGFKSSLVQKVEQLQAQVLIPVLEETFLVAKHKKELERIVKMVVPDYSQILTAHNKDQWEILADRLAIPHPRSLEVSAVKADPSLLGDIRFPVLLKPKQGGGGWAIQEFTAPSELSALLGADSYCSHPWKHFFIQEKIAGETHCVAMIFNNGALRGKVAYRQLREYPDRFGQAVLRESIRSERAEAYLQSLLEDLKWHGVCQADFVVEKNSGIPHLVDINPRFWGSVSQAIASGVDFPWLLYRIAMDGDVQPVLDHPTGVKSRWLGGELRAFPWQFRNCERRTSYLMDFFSPSSWNVYWDDFELRDPLPFFSWCWASMRRPLRRRLGVQPQDSLEGRIWE